MQTRQSGAAHVPIMFFLILLVIFIGTLVFAYVTLTDNNRLIAEVQTAKDEAKVAKDQMVLAEDYIIDVGRVINKPGEYKGRERVNYGDAALKMEGVMSPAEVKALMDEACTRAGVPSGSSLDNVLGALVSAVNAHDQRAKDAEMARDKSATDSQEMRNQFTTLRSTTDSQYREWSQNLDQARQNYSADIQSKQNTITTLQTNLSNKDLELIQKKEEWAEKEKGLRKEIALLEMQVSALANRERLRQPANVPDGKIIAAEPLVRTAFINLGKKDLLQPDTMFRIKSVNSDKVKGYARVLRVEDERAEVLLSGIVDPVGDFVRPGDQLYNNLYTPGLSRTIYLMGHFAAPYNKDTLANLLTRLGNRVASKMGPGVDTVVIGNDLPNEEGSGFEPIEDSDDYKMAIRLGCELAPLIKIRDLVAPTF